MCMYYTDRINKLKEIIESLTCGYDSRQCRLRGHVSPFLPHIYPLLISKYTVNLVFLSFLTN